MSPRDVAIAVLVMLIWGVNMAVAKTGLSELPPILLMAMRFSLVAALVLGMPGRRCTTTSCSATAC